MAQGVADGRVGSELVVRGVDLRSPVVRAGQALAHGEPILLYDAPDREGETDLVILSEHATPELIRLLRHDAGGLLCTAISADLKDRLGLPYLDQMLELATPEYPILSGLRRHTLRYDRRGAFGITVNHTANFTGIPDNDRATTIRSIGALARDAGRLADPPLRARFQREFASPGHVPLLYSAPRLLDERKGHTELAISLARMVGLSESATVCEMLGDSGGPRSPDAAEEYANAHGWVFLEGRSVVDAWRTWSA
jgi:3,4-dihydroxy 2-butanone 4-phosphate synthase